MTVFVDEKEFDIKSLTDVPSNQRVPMSMEQSEVFIKCMMADIQEIKIATDEQVRDNHPILQILWDRLSLSCRNNGYEPRVTLPALLFLAYMSRTPAEAVMWAYTLFQMMKKYDIIGVTVLSLEFPMGFPVDAGILAIWDAQKKYEFGIEDSGLGFRSDNMLDIGHWR